jgi:hypothetical protein
LVVTDFPRPDQAELSTLRDQELGGGGQ